MKKSHFLLLALVASSCNLWSNNPAQFNGEPFGYAGSLYSSASALDQASSVAENMYRERGLVVSVGYSDFEFEGDTDRQNSGEFQTSTVSVGYAYSFEEFLVGIALTGVDSEFESDSTQQANDSHEIDGDGFLASISASMDLEPLVISLSANFGQLSFESERIDRFTGSNGRSPYFADFDLDIFNLEASVYYDFSLTDSIVVTPYARFGFFSFEADGFQESRTGAGNIPEFDAFEDDGSFGELGFDVSILSFGDFHPYLRISLTQDFGDDEVEFTGVDEAGNRFEGQNALRGTDIAETVFNGEIGFGWSVSEEITLGASVNYMDGEAFDGFGAMLSFGWAL